MQYQRLRLYNSAPFSRLLQHAGDTEDVFSAETPGVPTGAQGSVKNNWELLYTKQAITSMGSFFFKHIN